MDRWRIVTEQQLEDFVNDYPIPLEEESLMGWQIWNDFYDYRKFPECMVAAANKQLNQFFICPDYLYAAENHFCID